MSTKTNREFNQAQTEAYDAIVNFILYFTSDEAERERMGEVACQYVEQDHVLSEQSVIDLADGDYRLVDGAAWIELNGLALRIRKDEDEPKNAVSIIVYESGNEERELDYITFHRPQQEVTP